MRTELAETLLDLFKKQPNALFVTCDLGYMAFEKLRDEYKTRFINAGVAEQNAVSFAAGLAYEGFIPWVYNIAPFAVLRPYEQIRNDVCLHKLPVKIVGNGGGYGYGIMGATHHTLEDIAVMRVLPNMKVYVPFISSDVRQAAEMMMKDQLPNYLRLNTPAKLDFSIPPFRAWRKIRDGKDGIIIGVGPVTENVLADCDFEFWQVGIFPIESVPPELVTSLKVKKKMLTIEEHCGPGGLNEAIAKLLIEKIDFPVIYRSLFAHGYPSGRYGSQRWHQEENGLRGSGLKKVLKELSDG